MAFDFNVAGAWFNRVEAWCCRIGDGHNLVTSFEQWTAALDTSVENQLSFGQDIAIDEECYHRHSVSFIALPTSYVKPLLPSSDTIYDLT